MCSHVSIVLSKGASIAQHRIQVLSKGTRITQHRIQLFPSMAPRIVSWSDQQIHISPVLSSAASIRVVSDSTFSGSDMFPSHFQMSPTASETHGAQFGANHTSRPDFLEDGNTPGVGDATPDGSFLRHDMYFFKDGNVTFLVRSRYFAHPTCLPVHRSMACYIVSINTSFLAIPSTSQRNLPSSAYVTMKLSLPLYQLATLNATTSRHSSPSYILRELHWIHVLTRWLPRLDYLQGF